MLSLVSEVVAKTRTFLTNAECSQLSHALLVLFVLDSFPNQLSCLSDHHDDHDGEHNLVHVNLVGHNMVGRDGNQHAENSEGVVPSLSWCCLEAEQLVKQRADSEEHRKIVT